ncbi:uncharacterized protein LOC121390649 isoform X2 [Gigantopelta aegis]|uniref:uncharacterized protein LOC121390649 isoform X2 n=1 Tax=Gigantopelta aegis TaxID=1735272 RepID=UPI001B88D071|nr:uncharacterized protein LOC121390649 isoform X2 [Gigantopelta aegis]
MARSAILPLFAACILLTDASQDDGGPLNVTVSGQPLLMKFPVPVVSSVTDFLHIELTKSTTSSLGITWTLPDYKQNGTLEAVFVGYKQSLGKFVSDRLDGAVDEFELSHLKTDTDYTVCVEVIENVTNTLVSHAKCVTLRTIKVIRTDSILILLFVIAYTIGLPVLGCIMWRRKVDALSGVHVSESHAMHNYGHDSKDSLEGERL